MPKPRFSRRVTSWTVVAHDISEEKKRKYEKKLAVVIYHYFITIFGLPERLAFSSASFLWLMRPVAKVAIVPDILPLAIAVVYGMNSVSCIVGTAFSLVAAFSPRRLAVRRKVHDTTELLAGSTR